MLLLEKVIRQHVHLSDSPTSSGWFTCICPVCNDHKVRGGFRFEDNSVAYNCFNCGIKAGYIVGNKKLSNKFRIILEAFDIPEHDYKHTFFDALRLHKQRLQVQKQVNHEPKVINFPNVFYPLSGAIDNDYWANYAKQYLKTRLIDWNSYPFYLSKPGTNILYKAWNKRLIIPFYKKDKVIFYQGRDLSGTLSCKYMNCLSDMNKVVYGFDEIKRRTQDTLFVVEGFFDAFLINGVAILHNTMSPQQIDYLRSSSRPKVIIPDNFGDGWKLAEQALAENWAISVPDIGDCKDVNEGMQKYGRLFVLNSIHDKIMIGTQGRVRLNTMKIKKQNDKKTGSNKNKTSHDQLLQ